MTIKRIFISHSNKDTEAKDFVSTLANILEQAGFDVLVDMEHLQGGVTWRDEIYTWMGLCDAAVIVFSPSVFSTDSPWVARETSILLWRRTLDPDFSIQPVYLDPEASEKFRDGNFSDLMIKEVQAVPRDTDLNMANYIAGRFANLPDSNTPLEEVAEQIASLLNDVEERYIRRAAEALDVDLGPWDPVSNPRQSLALQMLQVNLKESTDALELLSEHLQSEANADRILALIAPSWVDMCAARWIATSTRQIPGNPSLLLNASTLFAAEMYVRRACCKPPKTQWPIIEFSGVYSDKPVNDMIEEIKQTLVNRFGLVADPFETDVQQRLMNLLRNRNRKGKPVFVVLRFSPALFSILADLQNEFPLVTYFVLTGEDFPPADTLTAAAVRLIEPKLAPGVEQEARGDFDYARSVIQPN